MKIILSRKGFDSGYGGCASPIFPDGSMASFPIPDMEERLHSMKQISCGNHNLGVVVRDLAAGQSPKHPIGFRAMIHMDPDLRRSPKTNVLGWRQAFGQDGAAQSHLKNQSIGPGDLFLFFGWFRRVELHDHHWRYVPDAPNLHVIFGWLQVGEVVSVGECLDQRLKHQWLKDHPHIRNAKRYPANNTIYIATEKLVIGRRKAEFPGGGAFSKFSDRRRLTQSIEPGPSNKSIWLLPKWFSSTNSKGQPALSYHHSWNRWCDDGMDGNKVLLQSVYRGQEFVLDLADVPTANANSWLRALFKSK